MKKKKNILYLTLKAKWFWMIYEGKKTEEYRELKEYWWRRLHEDDNRKRIFDEVNFKLGYKSNAPKMSFEFDSLTIGAGKHELGAPEFDEVFIIKLGAMIEASNIPENRLIKQS